MSKCERDEREALVGTYTGSKSFVRERRNVGGDMIISVVEIVRVAIVVSVWRVFQGVRVHERESGGCRLAADIRSLLEGGREVAGAVMGCTKGLVRVGVFGTGYVGGLGTDSNVDDGDFMAEGCFGVGEVRGRDMQYLVADEL